VSPRQHHLLMAYLFPGNEPTTINGRSHLAHNLPLLSWFSHQHQIILMHQQTGLQSNHQPVNLSSDIVLHHHHATQLYILIPKFKNINHRRANLVLTSSLHRLIIHDSSISTGNQPRTHKRSFSGTFIICSWSPAYSWNTCKQWTLISAKYYNRPQEIKTWDAAGTRITWALECEDSQFSIKNTLYNTLCNMWSK